MQWRWWLYVYVRGTCGTWRVWFGLTGRAFMFVLVYLNLKLLFDAVWGCNLTLMWCVHTPNDDDGCACGFKCMERCRVYPGRKVCMFLLVYVCLNLNVSFVFNGIWGGNLTVLFNHGCVFMFVEYIMERRGIGHGRAESTFVLVCA